MRTIKNSIPQPVKRFVQDKLEQVCLHYVGKAGKLRTMAEFRRNADAIFGSRESQTLESVAALRQRYETRPIIGEVSIERLFELLAQVIDPTNLGLYCGSQLTHTLQVVESMEEAGITDRDLIIAALLHDIGKVALLKGEKPENIECGGKIPIGKNVAGGGFARSNFIWDHSDIVYARLKPYLNEKVAWLVRYHSIQKECYRLMDDHDRYMFETYFKVFQVHDQTYSFYHNPKYLIDHYIGLLKEVFPTRILF